MMLIMIKTKKMVVMKMLVIKEHSVIYIKDYSFSKCFVNKCFKGQLGKTAGLREASAQLCCFY